MVNQLDKSVTAKLEATLARQMQVQFQTSVKLTLQVCIILWFVLIDGILAAFIWHVTCCTLFVCRAFVSL